MGIEQGTGLRGGCLPGGGGQASDRDFEDCVEGRPLFGAESKVLLEGADDGGENSVPGEMGGGSIEPCSLQDVVLKPDFEMPRENLKALVEHEAGNRTRWAVGTAVGGPTAFPIAYVVTYFFFPGARNPFERMAGLESGGYTPSGAGPVLGPAQLAVLSALGAIIVAAPLVVRYRRAAAGSRR